MSQYQPPYPLPPNPQGPIDFSSYIPAQRELLAPARRASILQGVAGALLMLCGACFGSIPWTMDLRELASQPGLSMQLPPGVSLEEMLRIGYIIVGVGGVALGLTLLVLSFFVRHGGMGAVVTSIVIEGLIVLVLALNIIGALIQMASQPALGVVTLLAILVPIALFGLNIAWLMGAARNASRTSAARRQYQGQFAQYQQQQQAYGPPQGYAPYPPQGYGNPMWQGGAPQGYNAPPPQSWTPEPPPAGPDEPRGTSSDPGTPRPPEA